MSDTPPSRLGHAPLALSCHHTIQTDTETLLAGLRDLNLEHCKPSKLPGATPRTHDLTPLDPSEHKLYRRVVGRFLHCSAHRRDFAFTFNQLCRGVQSPTVSDMQALRKLARYIKGTLHYKLNIRPRHNTDLKIEAYTDADWAGQSDRHSITGGLLVLDGVNVSSWARTQKAIATSSGESELYAMSVGAAEALGLRELLTDIGLPTTVRLRCDSTAAMGTATRQGLGRMKHVQVRDLALQQWIADGRLTLQNVASSAKKRARLPNWSKTPVILSCATQGAIPVSRRRPNRVKIHPACLNAHNQRGESAPKVSPVRYSTCVTNVRAKLRTDWTALSAPPLLSCECVGLARVVTLIPRSIKLACTLSRTQQIAGSLSK